MPKGVIKRLVPDRGFGFIKTDAKDGDVFFHFTVVQDASFEDLREGQSVSYELDQGGRGDKGPRASTVTLD